MKHEGFVLREKERVDFDVNNPEHILAVSGIDMECKQHPTLRFAVRPPFLTVVDMARHDIAMKTYQDIRRQYEAKTQSPGGSTSDVGVDSGNKQSMLRAVH